MLWEYLRSEEFKDAVEKCNGVCAIPIGCLEAHSVHLPSGCDTLTAKEFTRRAAEKEPVCVFPALYFGEKNGAGQYPGTVIFPVPLIWQILEQCCFEIHRNGFKKIIIVSSHGGNSAMLSAFARNILSKKPEFLVFNYYQDLPKVKDILAEIEKYPYLTEEDIKILQDLVDSGKVTSHGGFTETGTLYDICPEYVRLDKINQESGKSTGLFNGFAKHKIESPFTWMASYPNSYNADPHEGMNERIAKAFGERVVELTANAFKYLREETISDEFHKEWLAKQ